LALLFRARAQGTLLMILRSTTALSNAPVDGVPCAAK
jgi:hypothetical protein